MRLNITGRHSGQKDSAFTRYFLMILSLVFVLLFLFSLYISYISSINYKQQQKLSEQGILMQATERVDNTLYLVSRLAAGTADDQDVITSAIVPSLDNPQRGFAIVSGLAALAEENVYIDDAYLYEHTKGYVFTSGGLISTISGMADSALISNCLYSPSYLMLQEEKNRYASRLVQDGQALYFVYDFIYTNDGPLSTLILKLNKEALFAGFLSTPSLDQYDVTVFGNRATPIYLTPDSSLEALSTKEASLSYASDYSSWQYSLYPRNQKALSWFGSLRSLLPFLGILLLVSLALTYFITRRAYSPIAYLTNLASGNTVSPSAKSFSGREFTYLENVYQKLLLDNETASSLIRTVRPALEEQLFTDLLSGKEYEEEDLTAQLARLNSNFHVHDKYQVLLFELINTSGMDPVSLRICLMHLQQTVGRLFDPSWGDYQLITDSDHRFKMILRYPQESSMAQIKRILRTFTAALDKELKNTSIDCLYEKSAVSNSLSEIRSSAEQAAEKLREQLYYSDSSEENDRVNPAGIIDEYYASILQQISEKISACDLPLAQAYLNRMLQELFSSPASLSEKKTVCEKLTDVLIERILPYQLEEADTISASYSEIYEKIRTTEDAASLEKTITDETASLMETLRTESKKSQKRIIARAKDYISTNYSNCDLSINDIAQYAGCSASYLSSVFSEYTGESLVTALNSYRVSMACDLLINSQILIRDIGLKTGFNTIQNFNRVFKKSTGKTPNEYRKSYQV